MARRTIYRKRRAPFGDRMSSDPFDGRLEVPVEGGTLNVAYAGPPPDRAESVVLAVHGITASLMAWRAVARHLAGRTGACLLAPDLRGRGRSAALPGPYGVASHVRDLVGALDHLGVRRAVMVGHSMGAHVVARLSVEHPDRVAGIVLVDGGLPRPAPLDASQEEPEDGDQGPGRMETPCASEHEYVAGWRTHPAFRRAWDADVEAYARYDMADDGLGPRCAVSEEAVMADSFDLLFDGATRTAITRVGSRTRLLRAPRGPLDDDCPVIPREYLDELAVGHPHLEVEHVPDTNHYTILMGKSPGSERVATAIATAIREAGAGRAAA
jgi:lipase